MNKLLFLFFACLFFTVNMFGQDPEDGNFASTLLHPESLPLTFEHSSDYPWVVQGGYVQSGNSFVDASVSSFSTTVDSEEGLEISFEWHAGSEAGYDFFNVLADSKSLLHYAGTESSGFQTFTFHLPAGVHILTWEYRKDGSVSGDMDAAQVRQLKVIHQAYLPEYDFVIENGVLVGYLGINSDVVIPDGVTEISSNVFQGNGNITSVVIPNSVENIWGYAFYGCNSLTSVTIPGSVTSIGDQAFAYCNNLQNITVEWTTPLAVSANVFERVNKRDCTLNVPEGALAAYQAADVWKAFFNTSDFEIDSNGVLIAYYGNGGDVVIPDGVTEISSNVFQNNSAITSVIIPASVTSIWGWAFNGCWALTSVTIPNSVTSIGDGTFNWCTSLASVTIPGSVESIGYRAFNYCTALTSVTIPGLVESIGNWAFYNCNNLTSVTIPGSVTSIEDEAFAYCNNLQNITVEWTTPLAVSANVFERVNKRNCTLHVPTGAESAYQAADVWKAFFNTSDFEIDSNGVLIAYYGDGGDVVIPNEVTAISNNVFESNGNITSVVIPNSVTSIEDWTFADCRNLTSVTIPGSVTSIGDGAFAYCNRLQNITVEWSAPLVVPSSVFDGVNKNICLLHVPDGTKPLYQAADVWKDFNLILEESESPCDYPIASGTEDALTWKICMDGTLTISGTGAMPDYDWGTAPWNGFLENITAVDIRTGVTSIGNYAFVNYYNLTSVTISGSVTSIGDYAFAGCYNLASVTIPGSVTSIGDWAFAYCDKLQDITVEWSNPLSIPSNVFERVNKRNCTLHVPAGTEAGYLAADVWKYFLNDSDFEFDSNGVLIAYYGNGGDVVIPDEATAIGNDVFWNNQSITSVIIPELVTSIGGGAFAYCTNLSSINIPELVTYIGWDAFRYCTNLSSIDIPETVTNIENGAFEGCSKLSSIDIPESVTYIGWGAFANCSGLQDVTVHWDTPLAIDPYVFGNVSLENCTLYVPTGTLSDYQAADVWKDFGTFVISVTGVNLDKTTAALLNGAVVQLTADVLPADATDKNVSWSTGNAAVATVSSTGLVTATGAGTTTITVTTADGDKTATCTVTVTLRSDAALAGLTVNQGTLTPVFDASVTSYTVNVGNTVTSIILTATANDAAASVSGNGTKTLNVGENPFDIVVTAEDGTTKKTYTVTVNRDPSSDAALSSLTVNQGTLAPVFDPSTTTYTVNVGNEITSIILTATANATTASVSGNGTKTLNVGENPFDIVVTAEDGTTKKTYTVTVTRAPSSDATLSSLTVNPGTLTPAFDASVTAYTVNVENAVTSITLTATANDAAASVSGDGTKTLNVGENPFEIVVTAEDGTTKKTYTVTVTRAPSSDAALSSLTVDPGTLAPAFDASVTAYTVNVENAVTSITLTATANDATASVSGNGTKSLNVGENPFDIVVTAEDGTTKKTYTVTVTRAPSNDATLSSLTVNQGTLTPVFDASVTAYTVNVENAVTSITLTATANDAAASVSGDGTKTLNVGENPFDIIVTAEDGTEKTYTVTVNRLAPEVIAVTSVSLDQTSLDLPVDDTAQLTATVLPENAANKNVTWSSSDESVATVSATGLVTAQAEGTATITVTTEDGDLSAECLVTVEKKTGIQNASPENPVVSIKDNMLRVKSSVAERISVYSTGGILLYTNHKQAGEALFGIGSLSDKVLIVKGNSGWVRKVVK